jgi:soluble lytic murein transglycosylase
VARSQSDPELAAAALRLLAADYLDEDRVAEALAALRELLALEASDTTGARPLWERGWEAYQRHDLTRATALWSDLVALYPNASSGRSARYWSARALDQLGKKSEAHRLYLEVAAAGTSDFYARQASLRLAGATAAPKAPPAEREPWPTDERLARAAALSELGLDQLAARELELVGQGADQRAADALGAVVLANGGDRRASLAALRRAFPDLGTAHQEDVPEHALALFYPVDFKDAIARAAAAEGLPVSLVFGIVHQESGFDAAATSRSGARGLMQVMPLTGRELARRLRVPFSTAHLVEPDYSLKLGTRYFRQLLGQFDGKVELALAGYNGGPGRIARLWRAAGPTPELDRFLEGLTVSESKNYVKRILVLAATYRSLYPDLG